MARWDTTVVPIASGTGTPDSHSGTTPPVASTRRPVLRAMAPSPPARDGHVDTLAGDVEPVVWSDLPPVLRRPDPGPPTS